MSTPQGPFTAYSFHGLTLGTYQTLAEAQTDDEAWKVVDSQGNVVAEATEVYYNRAQKWIYSEQF